MFSGFSNMMQNGLIAAIGDVVRCDIKEISAAPFVAAEVDESTDVTNIAQISVVMCSGVRRKFSSGGFQSCQKFSLH